MRSPSDRALLHALLDPRPDDHDRLAAAELLLETAPVATWLADFSPILPALTALGGDRGATLRPRLVGELLAQTRILDVNPAAYSLAGPFAASAAEMVAANPAAVGHLAPMFAQMAAGRRRGELAVAGRSVRGARVRAAVRWAVLPGHEHDLARVQIIALDRAPLDDAEALANSTLAQLADAVHAAPLVLFAQDAELRYTWAYGAALSEQRLEVVLGSVDHQLYPPEEARALARLKRRVMRTGHDARAELPGCLVGERGVYEHMVSAHRDDGGRIVGVRGAIHDITERARHIARLRAVASTDQLTRLPTRRRFKERLVAHHRRRTQAGAVVVVDIDALKELNDAFGAAAGDRVIAHVARVLARHCARGDTLARLGGDAFALLCPLACLDEARGYAAQLVRAVAQTTVRVGGQTVRITISAGVVPADPDRSAGELVADGQLAMREAKEAGVEVCVLAGAEDRARSGLRRRMDYGRRLRAALATGGFELAAQPLVSPSSGRTEALELFVRLPGADGDEPPAAWIPHALALGLAEPLDNWVLRQALELLSDPADPLVGRALAVNVFAANARADGTLARLVGMYASHAGAPRLLVDVIHVDTERDYEALGRFATLLKARGAQLVLDDYRRALTAIPALPPGCALKIPGDALEAVRWDAAEAAIFDAVLRLAELGACRLLASRVETPAQLEAARRAGVDLAQGYALASPDPLPAALARLRDA